MTTEDDVNNVAGAYNGSRPRPVFVRLSDRKTERLRWFWPRRIPAGKSTLFEGDPGDGKSTLTTDLVARTTTGAPMPDGSEGCLYRDPRKVIVLSAEDGIEDTIKPRVEAAGGDPDNVEIFDEVAMPGQRYGRPVELPADLPYLETRIAEIGAALVVVDPLAAFLGSEVDSHNDGSVRRALHPLAKLAERTGATVLVVRHLKKGSGEKALYRGGGSIGIAGAARAVHVVAPHPEDECQQVLAPVKLNLARKPKAIAYRLVEDELREVARVEWLPGELDLSADDLLAASDGRQTANRSRAVGGLTEAMAFLQEYLADGPKPSKDVADVARNAYNIAARTLERARVETGVQSYQKDRVWWLRLTQTAKTANPLGAGGVGGLTPPELRCRGCGRPLVMRRRRSGLCAACELARPPEDD